MPRLTREQARKYLQTLKGMGSFGRAENEPDQDFLRRFLPLKEHARVLDPEIILIIGDRGAGKTELFRAIQFEAGLKAIRALERGATIPEPGSLRWVVGYSSRGTFFPAELQFRQFAQNREPADLQLVWLGLLVRCLQDKGVLGQTPSIPSRLGMGEHAAVSLSKLFEDTKPHLDACFGVLDTLEHQLAAEDRWVFVAYDELDRISAGDWTALRIILRGLVQFWASTVRRWKRIRPKLFLRRDLYDRVALFGADVSKIAAQRVELLWSVRNLYALLIKRVINLDPEFKEYLGATCPEGEDRGELGWYPTAASESAYRPFVERICGKYMGVNPNKGHSFTWIPNHLQDGNGCVLPRSIVRLFEAAAEIELDSPRAEPPQLIHHASLRGALDRVSESRVQEIEDEEFPWMAKVRQALAQAHPQVPIERWELERLLTIDWTGSTEKPPETSGHGLLQILMELGIFYQRTDERVDVRDLYLKGFGLKRKGGVRRPH